MIDLHDYTIMTVALSPLVFLLAILVIEWSSKKIMLAGEYLAKKLVLAGAWLLGTIGLWIMGRDI